MIRRLASLAAGPLVVNGCSPHQSVESFEAWAVIIVVAVIGLAFYINHEMRH